MGVQIAGIGWARVGSGVFCPGEVAAQASHAGRRGGAFVTVAGPVAEKVIEEGVSFGVGTAGNWTAVVVIGRRAMLSHAEKLGVACTGTDVRCVIGERNRVPIGLPRGESALHHRVEAGNLDVLTSGLLISCLPFPGFICRRKRGSVSVSRIENLTVLKSLGGGRVGCQLGEVGHWGREGQLEET